MDVGVPGDAVVVVLSSGSKTTGILSVKCVNDIINMGFDVSLYINNLFIYLFITS